MKTTSSTAKTVDPPPTEIGCRGPLLPLCGCLLVDPVALRQSLHARNDFGYICNQNLAQVDLTEQMAISNFLLNTHETRLFKYILCIKADQRLLRRPPVKAVLRG